jgi:hypothetical protein
MARKKLTTTFDDRPARAECFLLCDYARAENGKLYIVGGGWDEIVPQRLPLDYQAYLAIKLIVVWEIVSNSTAALSADVRAELLDGTGQVLGDPVLETRIESDPVGVPEEFKGQARLLAALFMGQEAKMTLTEPGRFTLRLVVNDEVIAMTEFRVAAPRHALAASGADAKPETT